MKTANIRELNHNTKAVLAMMANGESVQIRRKNVPVAVISPIPPNPRKHSRFRGRLKSIYGDSLLTITGTDLISEERGDRS